MIVVSTFSRRADEKRRKQSQERISIPRRMGVLTVYLAACSSDTSLGVSHFITIYIYYSSRICICLAAIQVDISTPECCLWWRLPIPASRREIIQRSTKTHEHHVQLATGDRTISDTRCRHIQVNLSSPRVNREASGHQKVKCPLMTSPHIVLPAPSRVGHKNGTL
jgi:hypothetical protein